MTEPTPPFALLPAIDLRFGRCVRLEKGEAARETAYGEDPVAMAERFHEAGAEWVHVVDLDAAFGDGSNRAIIGEIAARVPLRVQSGGGLRSEADLQEVFASGVHRVVIGTAAIENPDLVERAIDRWGAERVAVGIDARGTRPATRGWTEESGEDLFALGASLARRGVRTLIYTDIDRDGMMGGPNLAVSRELAERSGARVIVSGGIRGGADVEAVAREASGGSGFAGVIVGKAIYEGRMDVRETLQRLRAPV